MITLKIYLMGLVALVEATTPQGNPNLAVLLKNIAAHHSEHVPVLIYEPEERYCGAEECTPEQKLADGNLIAELIGRAGHGSPGLRLAGESITITGLDPAYSGPALSRSRFSFWEFLAGAMPSDQNERQSDRWIPRMWDIAPDSSRVSKQIWDGKNLAAKLVLDHGCEANCLKTYSLADIEGLVRTMAFKIEGSTGGSVGVERAVADIAVIELKVRSDTVKIQLDRFDGKDHRSLELKPKDDVVEILLGNLSPLDRGFNRQDAAEHFSLYTRLSDKPRKSFEMPIPHIGLRSMAREAVEETTTPEVIQAANPYLGPGRPGTLKMASQVFESVKHGGQGGTNRPICTLAVMEAPEQIGDQSFNVPPPVKNIQEALDRAVAGILPLPDVTGVEEVCDGTQEDGSRGLLRILTVNKKSQNRILDFALKQFGVLSEHDLSFELDLQVSPQRFEAERSGTKKEERRSPMDRWRPLRPGVSIGLRNAGSMAGSLGIAVLRKEAKGEVRGFLTAAHLFEGSGVEVCQPAPSDKHCTSPVGDIAEATLDNLDSAFVKLRNGMSIEDKDVGSEDFKFNGVKKLTCADKGERVHRYGRSTDSLETGRIYSVGDYDVMSDGDKMTVHGFTLVPYDQSNPKDDELSAPGDSGSVWFVVEGGERLAVGLHVGGESAPEPEKESALASDLCRIFEKMNLFLPNGKTCREADSAGRTVFPE